MLKQTFHKSKLNPNLWSNKQLDPKIRSKLIQIANKAYQSAKLPSKCPIDDILLVGSNASFSYSDFSDIDLHIKLDIQCLSKDTELARKYLEVVKWKFNNTHSIKIKGHDVEIYFEDLDDETKSDGIYSVKDDKWLVNPFKRDPNKIEWKTVHHDIDKIRNDIKQTIQHGDSDDCKSLLNDIRSRRQQAIKELGPHTEYNYVFKILRAKGDISQLKSHCVSLDDKTMSEDNEDKITGSADSFKDYHSKLTKQHHGKSGDNRLVRRGADSGKHSNLIPQKYKEAIQSPRLTMLQKNEAGRIVLNKAEIAHIQKTYGIRNMDSNGRKLGKTGITVTWDPYTRAWIAEYTG